MTGAFPGFFRAAFRAAEIGGRCLGFLVLAALGRAAEAPDHRLFDALLQRHVVDGFVEYEAFKHAPEFNKYLESLSNTALTELSEPDRLAFWLNAYNAWTIQLVNSAGERDSIRNITVAGSPQSSPGPRGNGPWTTPIARLAGKTLSLDQIEHDIIRKQFREPRIHFALVCAAAGCPPLRSEAYVGTRLDKQLEDQARIFIEGSPEKNRVDVTAGIVYLSPLFDWYRGDFGETNAALGRFVSRYESRPAAKRFLEQGRFKIQWTTYDWSLNDRSRLTTAPFQIFERMLRLAEQGETDRLRRGFALVEPLTREHAAALGRPADEVATLIRSDDSAARLRGVRKLVAYDVATLLLSVPKAQTVPARTLLKTATAEWSLLEASTPSGPQVAAKLAAAIAAVDANQLAEARASAVTLAREIAPTF